MDRRPLLVAAAAVATLLAGLASVAGPSVAGGAAPPAARPSAPSSDRPAPSTTRLTAPPTVPVLAGSTTSVTTSSSGRPYLLHVPPDLLAAPPLLLALHARALKPGTLRDESRFERLADEQGFVVAFPTGGDGAWNAGSCCSPATRNGNDDVAYLDEVLRSIAARVSYDPDRVAVVGASNGGMMALRYACERPQLIASVGVVSGVYVSPCTPSRAVPVLALHGALDDVVPLRGGTNRVLHTTFPGVSASLEPFRRAGSPVVVRVVPAAGHTWMTRDLHGVDASRVLVEFVRDHPRLGPP